jgi:choline transport protein
MVSGIIQGLIALNDESYVPQRWHGTLITIAIIFNAIMFNTFLAVKLPLIEGILLGLHVCGVFVIVVPLWVMGPRAPVRTALLDYQNLGGWDSMGLAALIGMVTPLNVLIGYDCSVHMCKYWELPRSVFAAEQ